MDRDDGMVDEGTVENVMREVREKKGLLVLDGLRFKRFEEA